MHNFKVGKVSLLILGVTAFVFSRTLFALFNDSEGPNPVVITVAAAAVFFPSLAAYLANLSKVKKLLVAIIIQALIAAAMYFSLK